MCLYDIERYVGYERVGVDYMTWGFFDGYNYTAIHSIHDVLHSQSRVRVAISYDVAIYQITLWHDTPGPRQLNNISHPLTWLFFAKPLKTISMICSVSQPGPL
jgi:hypothetical protein